MRDFDKKLTYISQQDKDHYMKDNEAASQPIVKTDDKEEKKDN